METQQIAVEGAKGEGARYEATVPDTLDLAERAEIALNGLCRTVDPEDDYMMYFHVNYNNRPAYMLHNGADSTCTPKFASAIPQMRLMCGSREFEDVEEAMLACLLQKVSEEDGLYYRIHDPERPWHDLYTSAYDAATEECAVVGTSGTLMIALMQRKILRGDDSLDGVIRGLARGMERVAIRKDDYAYYPDAGYGEGFAYPKSGWRHTREPGDEHEGGEGSVTAYHGYQMRSLSIWAAQSGDEQALEFAGRLAKFVMKRKFWSGVSDAIQCSANERGHADSHFHARGLALRGLLEYGLVAGDAEACEFVRSAYEYARQFGIPALGFIPTYHSHRVKYRGTMEACYLSDVITMSVKLSEAGYGDFWEDADRTIRNHLIEGQLVDKSILERIVSHSPDRAPGSDYMLGPSDKPSQLRQHPGFETVGEDVVDRMLGIFGSWLGVTSLQWSLTGQCCTANGTRALYYAWESITRFDGTDARVNLFLNRAAPWLDVDSFLPYEGRVVIRNKQAKRISVRIPPWVSRSRLECRVNGQPHRPWYAHTYAVFDETVPGDVLELVFPLPDRTISATAHAGMDEETVYTIQTRGNTVVDISPRETSPRSYPYYCRDHMKEGKVQMKKTMRYVAPIQAVPY